MVNFVTKDHDTIIAPQDFNYQSMNVELYCTITNTIAELVHCFGYCAVHFKIHDQQNTKFGTWSCELYNIVNQIPIWQICLTKLNVYILCAVFIEAHLRNGVVCQSAVRIRLSLELSRDVYWNPVLRDYGLQYVTAGLRTGMVSPEYWQQVSVLRVSSCLIQEWLVAGAGSRTGPCRVYVCSSVSSVTGYGLNHDRYAICSKDSNFCF
jgi:hypothetical protein